LEKRVRAGLERKNEPPRRAELALVTSSPSVDAVAIAKMGRTRKMRSFGLMMALLVPLFASVLPWALGKGWHWWPCAVAAVFALFAAVAPNLLWVPFQWWMRLGHALGYVNSRIFLGVIFYLVITPIGLLRRIFSADPMNRKWDPQAKSYRQDRPKDNFVQRMEAPY